MQKQIFTIGGSLIAVLFVAGVLFSGDDADGGLPSTNKSTHMDSSIQGLQIEILTEGSGASIASGQVAVVHYTGMLTDGTVFDSSIPRGKPFPVNLGRGEVIKGWDLGLVGMKVGEKRKLTIAPELGYGVDGYPGVIPGNATLIFDVSLEAIQ